jgi:nitrite transporter NirC
MIGSTVQNFAETSRKKIRTLEASISRYFVLSMLAGLYVGFGIVLIFSIGAPLAAANSAGLKALMGASFGVALTLVIFAGSELFTGNNMVMTIGTLSKKVTWMDTMKLWVVCYLGNLAGSLILAMAISMTGIASNATASAFVLKVVSAKMNGPLLSLFINGILCNILVCLAVWLSARAREDTAKIFLIFWCLFAFIGSGFEHSVANMTLLGVGLFIPHDPQLVSWAGFARNLVPVSLGNIIGGAFFVGWAYWYIAQEPAEKKVPEREGLENMFEFALNNSGDGFDLNGFTITHGAKEHIIANSNGDETAIREVLGKATSIASSKSTKEIDIEIAKEAVKPHGAFALNRTVS